MSSVCLEAEAAIYSKQLMSDLTASITPPLSPSESIAKAAVEAANNREAVLIFTLTYSGTSARLLAKYRPRCPIIVLTKNASAGASPRLPSTFSSAFRPPSTRAGRVTLRLARAECTYHNVHRPCPEPSAHTTMCIDHVPSCVLSRVL